MHTAAYVRDADSHMPLVDQDILASAVRIGTYEARRELCLRVFARDDELRVLLFLHARASRAFESTFLRKKLGIRCEPALARLEQLGLVRQSSAGAYCYGVENACVLRAIDELSVRYHGALALLEFFGAMDRTYRPLSRPRAAHRGRVAKPKQFAAGRPSA